jgi:hypothetical protein
MVGRASAGWDIGADTTMFKMAWQGALPAEDEAPEAIALGDAHREEAMALTRAHAPGPSARARSSSATTSASSTAAGSSRWPASACMPGLCARSAACARTPISRAAARPAFDAQAGAPPGARGETPFLHVMRNNERRALFTSGWASARTASRRARRHQALT